MSWRMIALLWCASWPGMAPFDDSVLNARRGYLGVMVQALDESAIEARRAEIAALKEPERSAAERRADALQPGLLIAGLYKNGPAQAAGLLVDDVIVSVGDMRADGGLGELQAALRRTMPGEKVAVRCLRIGADGKPLEIEATIVPISREAILKLEPPAAPAAPARGGGRNLMSSSNFDDQKLNSAPVGWRMGRLGAGAAANWEVVAAVEAPSGQGVLTTASAERDAGASHAWDLCVDERVRFPGDCISKVRIRSDGDGPAAGGGIVFGYQDDKNFYAAVLDFRSKEALLYKVVNGRTEMLKKRDSDEAARAGVSIEPGKWHTLQAERQTTRLLIRVDGQERALLDARDRTFTGGMVGVLAPAGASTRFDDLSAEEPVKPNR